MAGDFDELWFTRLQSAKLIGLGDRQFDAAIRPRLPDDAVRGHRQSLRFSGPAVVAAAIEYRLELTKPAPTDGDPLLAADSDSPNLERYRLAKAIDAEATNAERFQHLVDREMFLSALRPSLSAMSQAGDNLVKRFGNEAGEIFSEGLNEFVAASERVAVQFDAERVSDVPADGRRDATPPVAIAV